MLATLCALTVVVGVSVEAIPHEVASRATLQRWLGEVVEAAQTQRPAVAQREQRVSRCLPRECDLPVVINTDAVAMLTEQGLFNLPPPTA